MSGAVISACGRYRYALERDTGVLGAEGTVLFVMLNPSTADAAQDDPTIRRCIGFARRWQFARLTVANVYALRATNPAELWRADDPVGPDNDYWIDRLAKKATDAIAAWGVHAKPDRAARVRELVEFQRGTMRCLGQTRALAPKHPLYLAADTRRGPLKRMGRMA